MSYDLNKLGYDRKEVVFIDIELDQNDVLTGYALDPGPDGLGSFNTPKTTSNSLAFVEDNPKKIYRFSTGSLGYLGIDDIPYFPILDSVSFSTPEIKPGEKLGTSASINIKLNDMITNDVYELPGNDFAEFDYSVRRVTGSFLTKLFSRNFLENRVVRAWIGYQDPNEPFDINNFRDELYVLKTAKRTNDDGANINALDPLFLTTETKAKAPVQSSDILKVAIDNTTTQITVYTDDPDKYNFNPNHMVDYFRYFYPVIMIDKELTAYDIVSKDYINGEITLSITRGTTFPGNKNPANVIAHDAGVKIQLCLGAWDESLDTGMNVVDIIWNLITQYTSIKDEYINKDKWLEQKEGDLAPYVLTSVVSKPTAVDKLINQLIQLSGATLFWDTDLKELTLLGTSEFTGAQFTFDENIHIEQDSLTVTNNDSDHITRQSIIYNKKDYVENDDFEKYNSGFLYSDTLKESPAQYDVKNEGTLIKSNWLGNLPADDNIAVTAATRNVQRRSDIPKTFKFTTDPAYIGNIGAVRNWLGSVIGIKSKLFMNPDLTEKEILAQITKLTKRSDGYYDVTAINFSGNVSNADYEINAGEYINIDLETNYPPISGKITTILIKPGAIIGSSNRSLPAMTTGSYPDGLAIINRGQILGAGGGGGSCSQEFELYISGEPGICDVDFGAQNGQDGGDALLVETPCSIDNLGGSIYSGGGGGGAQVSFVGNGGLPDNGPFLGGGGSGGQGFIGGLGGDGVKLYNQSGQDGENGSIDSNGTRNADGGAWGESGESSLVYACGSINQPITRAGGQPGYSINGISNVTWIAGQTLIKGPTI